MRRPAAIRDAREGSVLIIVLLVLAAATMIMLESGKLLRVDYEGAAYQRTLASGGALLASGLYAAEQALADDLADGAAADHPYEDWANLDAFFQDISAELESGELECRITPEDARIDLNSLKENTDLGQVFVRLADRLCEAHGIDGDGEKLLNSVKIWLGAKDETGDEDWYALEEPGYAPAGGEFRAPAELLLVRWQGLDDEDRRLVLGGGDGIPGLVDFVTVWGDGKINMNFAPPEILEAACAESSLRAGYAAEVRGWRSDPSNDFRGDWYKDVALRVGLDMAVFPSGALDSTSTVFRVETAASVGAGRLRSTAILERSAGRCVVKFENIH
jgi:type II secretory pathway component PulK